MSDIPVDVAVSCDGTWQKWGHSSLYGVVLVTAIETGKAFDREVKSRVCISCQRHSKIDASSDEYRLWKQRHLDSDECSWNFEGSANAIEFNNLNDVSAMQKQSMPYCITQLPLLRNQCTNFVQLEVRLGVGGNETHKQMSTTIPFQRLSFKSWSIFLVVGQNRAAGAMCTGPHSKCQWCTEQHYLAAGPKTKVRLKQNSWDEM